VKSDGRHYTIEANGIAGDPPAPPPPPWPWSRVIVDNLAASRARSISIAPRGGAVIDGVGGGG